VAAGPELAYGRETRRRGRRPNHLLLLLVAGMGWAVWRSSQGLPVIPSNLVMVGGTVNLPGCGCTPPYPMPPTAVASGGF